MRAYAVVPWRAERQRTRSLAREGDVGLAEVSPIVGDDDLAAQVSANPRLSRFQLEAELNGHAGRHSYRTLHQESDSRRNEKPRDLFARRKLRGVAKRVRGCGGNECPRGRVGNRDRIREESIAVG